MLHNITQQEERDKTHELTCKINQVEQQYQEACEDRDSIRIALCAALDRISSRNSDSEAQKKVFVSQIWEGAGEEAAQQRINDILQGVDALHATVEATKSHYIALYSANEIVDCKRVIAQLTSELEQSRQIACESDGLKMHVLALEAELTESRLQMMDSMSEKEDSSRLSQQITSLQVQLEDSRLQLKKQILSARYHNYSPSVRTHLAIWLQHGVRLTSSKTAVHMKQ